MTMLSFRVEAHVAEQSVAWSARLGIDRSELLREALRLHLDRLAAEDEVAAWLDQPLSDSEQALAGIADWGPAEDWRDWADAAR